MGRSFIYALPGDGSLFQAVPYDRDDLLARRHQTEKCRRATVDDGLAVHENLEFPVVAPNHFNVKMKFTTKTRRHTDGVKS